MSLANECILALALIVVAASVQSAREEDYPEVELPGVAVPDHEIREDSRRADPCCFPDQWQANITGQAGISGRFGTKANVFRNIAIYVDQKATQMAAKSDEGGRFRNKTGGFLIQFKDNKADLYMYSATDQKCKHVELKNATFKPQCIPANSTMKEVTVGPATGGLKAQAWSFRAKSPEDRRGLRMFVSGSIVVMAENCLPVAFQDCGMIQRRRPHSDENNAIIFDQAEDSVDSDRRGGGTKFMLNELYLGAKNSIDDPNVFTKPTYCNSTLPVMSPDSVLYDEDYDSYGDIVERYVAF
jgi:hypothetical protein